MRLNGVVLFMKTKVKQNKVGKSKIKSILFVTIISLVLLVVLRIIFNLGLLYNLLCVMRTVFNGIRLIVPLIIVIILFKNHDVNIFLKIFRCIYWYVIVFIIYAFLSGAAMYSVEIFVPYKHGDIEYTEWKPILYLYPEKDMDVKVNIEHPEYLMTTYPKYNDGWNVHVLKDGSMYDINNKYYYALYWDEVQVHKVDFREGFYVTKDNAIEFLEDKLSIIGLNDKERNEFIMYWLPKLEDNGKSLVYFELTEEVEKYNKLDIKPVPDSMLRVIIHIKKVDKKVSIKEEKLETFNRIGFSAVEWGGTLYN